MDTTETDLMLSTTTELTARMGTEMMDTTKTEVTVETGRLLKTRQKPAIELENAAPDFDLLPSLYTSWGKHVLKYFYNTKTRIPV